MPIEILRHALCDVVAKLVQHVGFEQASMDAIDILVDVFYNYLKTLSASIADIAADDEYYSVHDGLAVLELMNEPLSNLLSFAAEVENCMPVAAPVLCVPLASKMKTSLPPKDVHKLAHAAPPTPQPYQQEPELPAVPSSSLSEESKPTENPTALGRPQRNLPSWANRVKYQMARVTYDLNVRELIEHELPPPILPRAPPPSSATRLSSRSSTSVFRRPPPSLPSASDKFDDVVPLPHLSPGPKPVRSSEEAWAAALKAPMPKSPTPIKKTGFTGLALPSLPSSPLLEDHPPTIKAALENRDTPLATKRRGRRIRSSTKKRPPKRRFITPAHITSAEDTPIVVIPAINDVDVNSPPPNFGYGSSPSSTQVLSLSAAEEEDKKPSPVLNSENVLQESSVITPKRISPTPCEQVLSSPDVGRRDIVCGSPLVAHESNLVFDEHIQTPLVDSNVFAVSPLALSHETENIKVGSPCVLAASPVPSDSSTIPLVDDEGARNLETPHTSPVQSQPLILHFPATATRHRSPNPSSSSSSSSSSRSSPTSASTSTAMSPSANTTHKCDTESILQPQEPPPLLKSSINNVAQEHPSRLIPPLSTTPSLLSTDKQVNDTDSRGSLKIKIRLGAGAGGADSRSTATTKTSLSRCGSSSSNISSTSSSSVGSPSQDSNADGANARRHSAIPPTILTSNTARPTPETNLSSVGGQNEPKAPKLVIKLGLSGRASSSTVHSFEPGSGLHREKLRGSSISSVGSSSPSSSSSVSAEDEDEAKASVSGAVPSRLPPPLHQLNRLPSVATTAAAPPLLSRIPTTFRDPPSVDKGVLLTPSSDIRGKAAKFPPLLRPLRTKTSPPAIPLFDGVGIVRPQDDQKREKKKSSSKKKISTKAAQHTTSTPRAAPFVVAPGKRARVDSVFSDAEEEDESGDWLPIGSCVAKRKRCDPVGITATQVAASLAGTSYYFNKDGVQIWLCPICHTEEQDGLFMIGCDGCDDWYHGQCLGINEPPTMSKWYCPTCRESGSAQSTVPIKTTNSRHHNDTRRRSQKHTKKR